jgi:hypothetical protein
MAFNSPKIETWKHFRYKQNINVCQMDPAFSKVEDESMFESI